MDILEELVLENGRILKNLKKASKSRHTFESLPAKLNELQERREKFNQVSKGISKESTKLLDLTLTFKY